MPLTASLCIVTRFLLSSKTVSLAHGNSAFNEQDVRIVDNSVHNRVINRAVLRGIRVDSVVPIAGIVLRAEDGRAMFRPRFNNFKQVKRLLKR